MARGGQPSKRNRQRTRSDRGKRRSRRTRTDREPQPDEPKKRLRFGKLPVPPDSSTVPYAKKREELKAILPAEQTRIFMQSWAFCTAIKPELDAIDAVPNGRKRQRPRVWKAHELESIVIYGRYRGKLSIKESLQALAGDQRGRRLLGFTSPRIKYRPGFRTIHDCLPSESTMSRYLRERWDEERRLRAYRELEGQLRDELLRQPEFREELRILDLDGTNIDTHFTGPIYRKTTGEVLNAKYVTAPEAGNGGPAFVDGKPNPKAGFGWHVVIASTHRGTPVSWKLVPRDVGETTAAAEVLDELRDEVKPQLRHRDTTVLSADGNFSSNDLRAKIAALEIIANIHEVSHAKGSEETAEEQDERVIPIDDRGENPNYKNWHANGHRELKCKCGKGRSERVIEMKDGHFAVRTTGRCAECGNITITTGRWRLSHSSKFVPCQPEEMPDWSFGNPLTYHDKVAQAYGQGRFGHQEGMNGTLSNGYKLIKGKRWFRRTAQAELDVAMVFSLMHTMALEKHRRTRQNGSRGGSGPGGPSG